MISCSDSESLILNKNVTWLSAHATAKVHFYSKKTSFQYLFYLSQCLIADMYPLLQRWGTAHTLPVFLCCSMYCLFCVILCIVCV